MIRMKRKRRGFTFIEVAAVAALTGLVVIGVTAYLVAVYGIFQRQTIADAAGNFYPEVPNQAVYSQAFRFHARLRDALDARTHLVVLGGMGQTQGAAPTTRGTTTAPALEAFATANLAQYSSAAPYANARTLLRLTPEETARNLTIAGALEATNTDQGCFTMLVFQGTRTLTAVAQCRRVVQGNMNLYRCTLRDGAGLARATTYNMAIRQDRDTFALPVEATTFWQGDSSGEPWMRFKLPTYRVVFPDPVLTGGANVEPYSQFTYFENALR